MLLLEDAGKRNDRKTLDGWVHHLRSSWAIIHADQPLWNLYTLLHESIEYTDEELGKAVKARSFCAGCVRMACSNHSS